MNINVKRIKHESRDRDLKRKRLLVQIGKTVLHLPRKSAIVLQRKLRKVLFPAS